MPDPVKALMDCHRLRVIAKPLGIARLDAGADSIQIQFAPNPQVDAGKIVALIQRSREYQLSGPDRLKVQVQIPGVRERVKRIRSLFAELSS